MVAATMIRAHFILFVASQARSTAFYRSVLACAPTLDVPGMSEFELAGGATLGIMPASGARRLLSGRLPQLAAGQGAPATELYLVVASPAEFHARALRAGAVEISPLLRRDWGHDAAYCLDPDGHVIAFAAVADAGREG